MLIKNHTFSEKCGLRLSVLVNNPVYPHRFYERAEVDTCCHDLFFLFTDRRHTQ